MEEESQNQPKSDEWGAKPTDEQLTADTFIETPAPKDPNTTPTAELVADYEALLADIKSREANHAANLAVIDGMRVDALAAYADAVKGMSVEATKLRTLISKRLGMPLNGAQPSVAQGVTFAGRAQAKPSGGVYAEHTCPVCHKVFGNGFGMHLVMHQRKGETAASGEKPRSHHVQTRWCDDCNKAIGVKGWAVHKATHKRLGKVIERTPGGHVKRYGQSMADGKIREMLIALRKCEPTSSKAFGERFFGGTNISAFMTGLKERGLAVNDENTHQWHVTPKGAAFIS